MTKTKVNNKSVEACTLNVMQLSKPLEVPSFNKPQQAKSFVGIGKYRIVTISLVGAMIGFMLGVTVISVAVTGIFNGLSLLALAYTAFLAWVLSFMWDGI